MYWNPDSFYVDLSSRNDKDECDMWNSTDHWHYIGKYISIGRFNLNENQDCTARCIEIKKDK